MSLFQNGSARDNFNPALDGFDADAIEADVLPLHAGQTSSPANISGWIQGVNGLIVDATDLPGTPNLGDFSFRVGTSSDPATWAAAPAPVDYNVQTFADGKRRMKFAWADGAITNEWLQVTLGVSQRTGLDHSEVFYFGNQTSRAAAPLPAFTAPKVNDPAKVKGFALGGSEIRPIWSDDGAGAAGYLVMAATEAGGVYVPVGQAAAGATGAVVGGLRPATRYYLHIQSLEATVPMDQSAVWKVPVQGPAKINDVGSSLQSMAVVTTMAADDPGWYEVNVGSITHGEARYAADGTPDVADHWVWANNWQSAVYQAVDLTAHVNETNHDYTLGSDNGAFMVGEAADIHQSQADNDLSSGLGKVIALEDSYQTTNIDSDFDDYYWKVDVKSAHFTLDDDTKTYSDQIAGETANYLPGNTGLVKDYILMGTRANDNAYTRMDLTITGDGAADFKRDVQFAYHTVGGQIQMPLASSSWSNNTVSINAPRPTAEESSDKMQIQMGFDKNGDGKLAGGEIIGTNPNQFLVIDQMAYNEARGELIDIYSTGWLAYPHAANFLYCFANNLGLAGAANATIMISSADVRLDHHVGANFTVSGNANGAVFSASQSPGDLSFDIANSGEIIALLNSTIDYNINALRQAAPPDNQFASVGPFPMVDGQGNAATGVNFTSGDLHFALGHVGLNNMLVTFEVQTHVRDDGQKELLILDGTIVGQLTDLYDFRHGGDESFATIASAVQAGYPTLGSGGHIFEVTVNFDNLVWLNRNAGIIP